MGKLSVSDIYYLSANPKKVADFINSLALWNTNKGQLVISPAVFNLRASDCAEGLSYEVIISLMSNEVTPSVLTFGDFTLTAAISDTITDNDAVPTINTTHPKMENGIAKVKVTLPAKENGYVAGGTVTVTISNVTTPDGRTLTGGTSVLTLV